MYILLSIERDRRRDVFGSESRVATIYDVFEVRSRDLVGRDVEGEDFEREVFERQVFPVACPLVGEDGNLFWDEETTI